MAEIPSGIPFNVLFSLSMLMLSHGYRSLIRLLKHDVVRQSNNKIMKSSFILPLLTQPFVQTLPKFVQLIS